LLIHTDLGCFYVSYNISVSISSLESDWT